MQRLGKTILNILLLLREIQSHIILSSEVCILWSSTISGSLFPIKQYKYHVIHNFRVIANEELCPCNIKLSLPENLTLGSKIDKSF